MNSQHFNQGLLDFLQASPSPYHAAANMAASLVEAGFQRLDPQDDWQLEPGGRYCLIADGGSLVAFVHGHQDPATHGLRMLAAHTDSPCLHLKPNPWLKRHGTVQLAVEVYGGALLSPWFDRDLGLAGRVVVEDAEHRLSQRLLHIQDPIATIPSLAIHLDREANQKRSINAQQHLLPVLALASVPEAIEDWRQWLAACCEPVLNKGERILDETLMLVDCQPPALIGAQQELIAAARLDNLLSCYIGMQALLGWQGEGSALLACHDHEEVGSVSQAGAAGPVLAQVLERWFPEPVYRQRLLARAELWSMDNAHALHPNYADRHDQGHAPLMNHGPVIKRNANQRYATQPLTSARFRSLCAAAGIPVQDFVVRTDMACGSTIGPISAAKLGVKTLDVGVPTLAMHSIRELAGSEDAHHLYRACQAFINHPAALCG